MSIAVNGIIDGPTGTGTRRRRIDITELTRSELRSRVTGLIDTEEIALEHRGDRTYVVIDRSG
ncbi:MAG: hypothetical protein U5K37_09665 [Natrialbaceae archaeon]|nr:hypothetical protein [Natrialbaceae archaeon]